MTAGIAAFRAGKQPHILQVFEVGTATMMAAKGAIKPVYEVMASGGDAFDSSGYLATVTGYYASSEVYWLSRSRSTSPLLPRPTR